MVGIIIVDQVGSGFILVMIDRVIIALDGEIIA